VTGLGEGLGSSGTLDPDRSAATLACLADLAARLDAHGVERSRLSVFATSALRRAGDAPAFLERAAEVLGAAARVLDGEEEARLAFLGATRRRDPAEGPFVTVDLGGGSCEFATEHDQCSVEFGAARLTADWVHHDPPRPEELVACLSIVEAHLDDVRRRIDDLGEVRTWLGLAGTFQTFAAVELGLASYDRSRVDGFVLSRAAAEDVYRTLVTEPLEDRVHNPGLPRERAEVIVGGACAVVAILRFFGLEEVVVSEADLLDGAAEVLLRAR
jgi:exopolyphosphatase/guanosine-5'-triphosphate,3'-diphosphate pyrophosphatase